MYKFITDEQRNRKDKVALKREEWLWDVVELRNKFVDKLKSNKKCLRLLKDNSDLNHNFFRSDLQQLQSKNRLAVSYLNYLLDLNRVDIPDAKKKSSKIKAFGGLTYFDINSYILKVITLKITKGRKHV